ncbi:MAG TPA: ATP-binding protein [bacterium]|nr:ATP-binding protein [bacterium]
MSLNTRKKKVSNRAVRLDILLEVSKRVSAEMDLDRLLDIVAVETTKVTGAERSTLFLVDWDRKEIWSKVALGMASQEIRFPLNKGVAGYVARTGEVIHVPDVKRDKRFNPDVDKASGYVTRNLLCMPLRDKMNEVIGVFEVLNKLRGHFTEEDVEFLLAFSGYAAAAVENAQLYRNVKNSRNKLEAVFDGILDPLIIHDAQYRIQMANRATVESFGIPFRELIGKQYPEVICLQKDLCHECPSVSTLRTGKPAFLERRDENSGRMFHHYTYPFFDERDRLSGAIVYMQDVTETEALRERLVQSERLAVLGEMAASVGHELNNYVGGITMRVQLLDELLRGGSLDKAIGHLKIIREYSEKLTRFTQKLLDAGKRDTQKELCNLHDIVNQTVEFLKPQPIFRHVTIELDLCPHPPSLLADAGQMEQVLINLLRNAAESMSSGAITIRTSYDSVSRLLALAVKDQGVGMSEEVCRRIFEPSFSKKKDGHGFGLAICYQIIRSHKGTIEVESKEGLGTTVQISLPTASSSVLSGAGAT